MAKTKVEPVVEKSLKEKLLEKKKKNKSTVVEPVVEKTKKELRAERKAKKVESEPVEERSPRKGKTKSVILEEAKKELRSVVNYDDMMDVIEKKYDTNSSQLATDPRAKLSTGLLVQDLVLSGGLLGGGWYTYFGQEQSAKSTLAMQSIIACLHTDVPLIQYWDYEGCHTTDTTYSINGKEIPFSELLPKPILDYFMNSPNEPPQFLNIEIPDVDTLGGTVKAKVFYGGIKECLKVTTETGNTLEGAKHPFMVQLPDGCLAWKMIEELSVGDVVLQRG